MSASIAADADGSRWVELAALVRRRWLAVVVCALAAPAVAFAISKHEEKRYTATANLLFRDPGLDQKLFGTTVFQPSTDPSREQATNIALVSLQGVAIRTSRALGGTLSPGQVQAAIQVTPSGQANLAQITATDTQPSRAARLANTFGEEYIRFRQAADRSKIAQAQQLVRRQLAALTPSERDGLKGRSLQSRGQQLELLSALQTGNAELVQRAGVPGAAAFPKTKRNVVFALFVGLLAGLGLAWLLNRIDQRLRTVEEVGALFDLPLLGGVPLATELARDADQNGVPARVSESFRMVRANLRYFNVDKPVRTVLVTSPAPGDGKSTVAWHLAVAAASTGSRVLMVEADLRRPGLSTQYNPDGGPGLSEFLSGAVELDEALRPVGVGTRVNGAKRSLIMSVIFAGAKPPNPAELLESKRMMELLEQSATEYDLVVVDSPPASVVSDAVPLIHAVDGVLVVGRLGETTRNAASHLKVQLASLGAPVLGLVVNGVSQGEGYYGGHYYDDASA